MHDFLSGFDHGVTIVVALLCYAALFYGIMEYGLLGFLWRVVF